MTKTIDVQAIAAIAAVCHEANRAYCQTIGDYSQVPWGNAPEWQRNSCKNGVRFRLQNPEAPLSAMHDNWMKEKIEDGWEYGPFKDPIGKTHPCILDYDKLPPEQRKKDALFSAIVLALAAD